MAATKLTDAAVAELVPRSQYVFRGRIRKVPASNLRTVPADERMAIVEVEEVVLAPPSVGDLTGKQLTVYLASTRGIRGGQRLNLAASSWHYGEQIGVVEEARFSESIAQVRDAFLDARLLLHDEMLEARVVQAELIVGGRVLSTRRVDRDEPGGDVDEPDWWEADLRVESIHKGRPAADHLHVWFPMGGEREWDESPKFFPGQDGIWLLSHGPIGEGRDREPRRKRRGRDRREREPFTALDPLDFHAAGDRDRIDALVLWTSRGTRKPER